MKEFVKKVLPTPLQGPARLMYRQVKRLLTQRAAPPPNELRTPPSDPALRSLADFSQRYLADVPVDLQRFGPFNAHKFPHSGPLPWLDRADAGWQIEEKLKDGRLTPEQAQLCHDFHEKGYVIVKGFVSSEDLDRVWGRYEAAVRAKLITPADEKKGPDDPHPSNTINAHTVVPEILALVSSPKLLELARLFLGVEPIPFQTLVFPKGREQLAHSDSIHMTTYPLGYMCAAWIAFEDIHPDSGPLMYYPGSHHLPYVFSRDVGIAEGEFERRGYGPVVEKYEPFIAKVLAHSGLKRELFLPRKGDVLLWHANLIHGGYTRHDVRHTRRSLVCHYFGKGAFAYHDLSGHKADRLSAEYM